MKTIFKRAALVTVVAVSAILASISSPFIKNAQASSFAVSPMYQIISIVPGEAYLGTFKITNPASNNTNFFYKLSIQPFAHDKDNQTIFENNGDYNQIMDWIVLPKTEGVIPPNATEEIKFTINVPEDAPAGGQYAAIMVASDDNASSGGAVNLDTRYLISHLIYADIAGETVRKGELSEATVPSFLFSGNITGSILVKNVGNVHSSAKQTMQIFPLFSKEEIYTNEEEPKEYFVMPGMSHYASLTWEETPSIGIFHVIYNVEYEGVESKVDKLVIVCPLWLLFLILLALFLLIFRILSAKKTAKKKEA